MKHKPVYLDNHLLVLVKPAGMLAQADETGDPDLLESGRAWLKREFNKPGNVFLGLVHRLDRPVSGLMVFARTSKAAARLTQLFKEREVEKRYMAIVEGTLAGEGCWTDHLVKDGRHVRVVPSNHSKGKLAKLSWRAHASRNNLTLVDIQLHTGRPHQIRLQFASRSHPLLGDMRYGAGSEFDGRNLALHNYKLAFVHPVRKTPLCWRRDPPESWRGYFDEEVASLR